MSKRKKYTKEDLEEAVKVSKSYAGVCRIIGLSPRSTNSVKKKIAEYKIDCSHFTGSGWSAGLTSGQCNISNRKKNIEEFLVKYSKNSSGSIRKRLLAEGLKEAKCECCEATEWLGAPIPLELHHVNGDHYDNRLENLLILCPNCHALTDSHMTKEMAALIQDNKVKSKEVLDSIVKLREKKISVEKKRTYKRRRPKLMHLTKKKKRYCEVCGKEIKGRGHKYCSYDCARAAISKNVPEKNELINKFKELKHFTKVGLFYGVSDNAVIKWCKKYGILELVKNMKSP